MEKYQSNKVLLHSIWQNMHFLQNSGKFVEYVVLPRNKRNIQRANLATYLTLQDVDADGHILISSGMQEKPQMQQKYFPVFIIGISLVQVLLMCTVDTKVLCDLFGFRPSGQRELWRFITTMLVHTKVFSLWKNVFLQLILGALLEVIHDWKRIALIYLGSVVGGSLFISVSSYTGVAEGASGGVYGLLFAHLSTIILNWNEMDGKCCRLFWLLLFIAFSQLDLYQVVLKEELNINLARNLGGAITGFLIVIVVLKNFEKHPWEEKMQNICIGILSAICVIVFFVNVSAYPTNRV